MYKPINVILGILLLLNCKSIQTPPIKTNIDLEALWTELKQYEEKGLWKTAIDRVNEIKSDVYEMKNTAASVKLIQYGMKYHQNLGSRDPLIHIHWLQDQISETTGNTRPLAQSLLAESVEYYWQQNSWRIKDISHNSNERHENMRYWSARHLLEYIDTLYSLSLNIPNPQERIVDYGDIISWGLDAKDYNPSVYYLMMDRYLKFWNKDHQISFDTLPPSLNGNYLFEPIEIFTKAEISDHGKFHRILINYQELLKHSIANENGLLTLRTDLDRLEYCWANTSAVNRTSAYEAALQSRLAKYKDTELYSEIATYSAQYYMSNRDQGELELQKRNMLEAKKICESCLEEPGPKTNSCQSILDLITAPDFQIKMEKVVPVNLPILTSVSHRNIEKIDFQLITLNENDRSNWNSWNQETQLKWLAKQKVYRSWEQELVNEQDYLEHKVEIKVDALPAGIYILWSKSHKDRINQFSVSNLALLASREENQNVLYVLDRMTGTAKSNVTVQLFTSKYDRNNRRNNWILQEEGSTESDGRYLVENRANNYYRIKIIGHEDSLILDDGLYMRDDYHKPQTQQHTFFFTDRSIYRPGQLIQFKGIAISRDETQMPSYLKQREVQVELIDANGQIVENKTYRTNDYGSFGGVFILPDGLLKGQYRIRSNIGSLSHTIRVEEYKRPRFSITLDTLPGIPKLNENIVVTGRAISYTGFGIQQAKVKYRITERPVFRSYHSHFSRYMRHSPILVAQGLSETDDEGRFNFNFTPIARKPSFNQSYQILVEVTDQSGETHIQEKIYTLDEIGKKIAISNNKYWLSDKSDPVVITYETLQGKALNDELMVQIYSLSDPGRIIRNRLWESPDQWLMPKEEFIEHFPHDPYLNEDKLSGWHRDQLIDERKLQVEGKVEWIPNIKLEPGGYQIIVKDGELSDSSHFYVSGTGAVPMSNLNINGLASYDIGDTAQVKLFHNALSPVYLIESNRNEESILWTIDFRLHHLVDKADQGGRIMEAYQLNLNRQMNSRLFSSISWSTRAAQIEVLTYREKTLPGSKETWSIRAKDEQGSPLKGLMTTTLYDASLDVLNAHVWQTAWFPNHYSRYQVRMYGYGLSYASPLQYDRHSSEWYQRGWFELLNYSGYMDYMLRGDVRKSRNQVMSVEPAMAEADAGQAKEKTEELEPDNNLAEVVTVPIRKNLRETVFFIDNYVLDDRGEATLKFTMNEALTKWKWKVIVHGDHLVHGLIERDIITEKQIMVFPSFPRIVREGDEIIFPAKIRNEQIEPTLVKASLELFNPLTKKVYDDLIISDPIYALPMDGKTSKGAEWKVKIPESFKKPLAYRILAIGETHTDGEEGMIPVLSNQIQVIETLPLHVDGNQKAEVDFSQNVSLEHLGKTNSSVTFEMNEQPLWEVIRALPLLLEDQQPNAISCINRIFGHAISHHIFKLNPDIQNVLAQWKSEDALKSPLQQDEELKHIFIEQTPWLSEALQETEHQKLLAEIAQTRILNQKIRSDIQQLSTYQTPQGGFSWITGGQTNFVSSIYILQLIDKLKTLDIQHTELDQLLQSLSPQVWQYLDEEIKNRYQYDRKQKNTEYLVSENIIHYIKLRPKYKNLAEIDPDQKQIIEFYKSSAYDHWVKLALSSQALIGQLAHESGDTEIRDEIIASILERSQLDRIRGRYWNVNYGFHIEGQPLAIQSNIIHLLSISGKPDSLIQSCQNWLLSCKQTQMWNSKPGAAMAVYSLLGNKRSIKAGEVTPTSIKWGDLNIDQTDSDLSYAGYWKKKVEAPFPESDQILVLNPNRHTIRGAAYLKYFETMDRITNYASSDLAIDRELFYTNNDGTLIPLDQRDLEPGDRLRVVLKVASNHYYEFVHLRDIRGAGLEPIHQISRFQYKSGIGFYISPGDAGQDFFITRLPPGEFTFEYDLFVAQSGNFSAGSSTIQCMYAPEFAAHSEGLNIQVRRTNQ